MRHGYIIQATWAVVPIRGVNLCCSQLNLCPHKAHFWSHYSAEQRPVMQSSHYIVLVMLQSGQGHECEGCICYDILYMYVHMHVMWMHMNTARVPLCTKHCTVLWSSVTIFCLPLLEQLLEQLCFTLTDQNDLHVMSARDCNCWFMISCVYCIICISEWLYQYTWLCHVVKL